MNVRHKSRETALQILYKLDMSDNEHEDFNSYMERLAEGTEARNYCEFLVRGVIERKRLIDTLIEDYSEHWTVDRMAVVERNILRVAVYELLFSQDISYRIIIDEAIELAKCFGSDESGAFINGVLDKVRKGATERFHPVH